MPDKGKGYDHVETMSKKVKAAFKKGPLSGMSARTEEKGTKGALHRQLGIPEGQKIPTSTLRSKAHGNSLLAKRARAALVYRGAKVPGGDKNK